jgi:hypothetical protein
MKTRRYKRKQKTHRRKKRYNKTKKRIKFGGRDSILTQPSKYNIGITPYQAINSKAELLMVPGNREGIRITSSYNNQQTPSVSPAVRRNAITETTSFSKPPSQTTSIAPQQNNEIEERRKNIEKLISERMSLFAKLNLPNVYTEFNNDILNVNNEIKKVFITSPKEQWSACKPICDMLKGLLEKEVNSTSYMLHVIMNSVIFKDKPYISFIYEPGYRFTNIWANDSSHITITIVGQQRQQPRLVMGFGPSASGKTFLIKQLIPIFKQCIPGFPDNFFTIDGGIYRETSIIYQNIVQAVRKLGLKGISELADPSFGNKPLFDSKKQIKSGIMSYLKKQAVRLDLYVPETLSKCIPNPMNGSCNSNYKSYIDYTNDNNWIGLNIWQHDDGSNCDKDEAHKCKGCKQSGEGRAVIEGKKYSSSAYKMTLKNGFNNMKLAPGGNYDIHSSGGRMYNNTYCISTFTDYSRQKNTVLPTLLNPNSFLYVAGH